MDVNDELLESLPGGGLYDGLDEVIVYLNFPLGKLKDERALDAVFDLQDIIWDVVEKTEVGRFDGNEFCEGPDEESVSFFMYGPDANIIYKTISPILESLPNLPGSYVLKRSGDAPNTTEEQIFLEK